MDFTDTPAEAEYRSKARAFLEANAAKRQPGLGVSYRAGHAAPGAMERAKAWQAKKADAGFTGITLPTEWGGQGETPIQQVIYDQEESKYHVPRGFFEIGTGLAVPTICMWGTPEDRKQFVTSTFRGEIVWCQLFSEPSGGSDLAGLRTRASKEGDDWIINGQKIWTSGAHYSDWGILVARSDPSVPKHRGLTFFLLDMRTRGIEIRPIKQISGQAHFNEVFFSDVRIPDSRRLGPVGGGWKVALTTLMNERFSVASEAPGPDFDEIFALARQTEFLGAPAIEHGAIRERLADWYIRSRGLKYTKFRTMTAMSRGEEPGPENSIGKLVSAVKLQEIAAFGLDILGPVGNAMDPSSAPMDALFENALLYSPGLRIAGGPDEVMKNIIAERVLGLPADLRADKDLPFNKIPTGQR